MSTMYLYRNIVQPALDRIGAPPGTLNIISGHARQELRDWLASSEVNDIIFFGGSDIGVKVGQDCVAPVRSRSWNCPATTGSWCGRTPTSGRRAGVE